MEYLRTIQRKELRAACFAEEIDILLDHETVGKFEIELKQGKNWDLFEFKARFHVNMQGKTAGTEVNSVLTYYLSPLSEHRHEYYKLEDSEMDKLCDLSLQDTGLYTFEGQITQDGQTNEYRKLYNFKQNEGFGCIASGMVLQRIMALRKCDDVITLSAPDTDGNLCDVTYLPRGLKMTRIHQVETRVYWVQGKMECQNRPILWDSYYHEDGLLMFYNQVNCPLYCLISKQSDREDTKFHVDLQEKHGLRFMSSITAEELNHVLFSEKKQITIGNNTGTFNLSVSKSNYKGKPCLFAQLNKHISLQDGFISSCMLTHLSFKFETMSHFQLDLVDKQKAQLYKIMSLDRKEKTVDIEEVSLSNNKVSRSKQSYSENKFDDFVSIPATYLIQRIIVLRGLKRTLRFMTIDETMKPCATVMLRPLLDKTGDSSNTLTIEWSNIPDTGAVSVTHSTFSRDGALKKSTDYGSLMIMKRNIRSPYKKQQLESESDIFQYFSPYENGAEFIGDIIPDDLAAVLFDEELVVVNEDSENIGQVVVTIENNLNMEPPHIMVNVSTSISTDDEKRRISITAVGKLSQYLTTLHQSLEHELVNDDLTVHRTCTIEQESSWSYVVTDSCRMADGEVLQKDCVINPSVHKPFISETASILIERLIIKKRIDKPMVFNTVFHGQQEYDLQYRAMAKSWKNLDETKLEMFNLRRTLTLKNPSQEQGSKDGVSWTLRFSADGHCLEQELENQPLKLINETLVEQSPLYPLHACDSAEQDDPSGAAVCKLIINYPMHASHSSTFSLKVLDFEVRSLLFDDNLIIVSPDSGIEIGQYCCSVDCITYKEETALAVYVHQTEEHMGKTQGYVITAYLTLDLEILDYRKYMFYRKDDENTEKTVTIFREPDGYLVQCINAGDTVKSTLLKLQLPANKVYLCCATEIIIQRLMVLRKHEDPLTLTLVDDDGIVRSRNYTPIVGKFTTIKENPFDIVKMYVGSVKHDAHILLFTRRAYMIKCTIRQEFAMARFCLLKNSKLAEPTKLTTTDISIQQMVPFLPGSYSGDILHSLGCDELEHLINFEEMTIFEEKGWVAGQLQFSVKNVHYEGKHCLLVRLDQNYYEEGIKMESTMSDLVLPNLEILLHSHNRTIHSEHYTSDQTVAMSKRMNQYHIKHITKSDEDTTEAFEIVTLPDQLGVISEATALLFQKIMVMRKMTGHYQFLAIDTHKNLVAVTLQSMDECDIQIVDQTIPAYCVQANLSPFKRCCRASRCYIDSNGELLLYKSLEFTPIASRMDYEFQLDHTHVPTPMMLDQHQFLDSITPLDLDSVLHAETADLFFRNRSHVGTYSVVIERVHYKNEHCLSVYVSTEIQLSETICTTMVWAILGQRLEVLEFMCHEVVGECTDKKVSISLTNDGIYKIDSVQLEGKEILHKELAIPAISCPLLCCEAVLVVLLQLIVKKRFFLPLNLITVSNDGNICPVTIKNLGPAMIRVRQVVVKTYHLLCEIASTENEDKTQWHFHMTSEGRLLTRKQVGVAVNFIAPAEVFDEAQMQAHLFQQ